MPNTINLTNQGQNISNFAVFEKTDQNTLKGLFWMNAGVYLSVGTTLLVGVSIAALATTAFDSRMIVPTVLFTAAFTYPALKTTENCFRNAIYHYGPRFEVVKSN